MEIVILVALKTMESAMNERLNLPEPIAAYFAADKLDGEAVARCFAKDAVVKDEGRTYVRRWPQKPSIPQSPIPALCLIS